MDTQGFLGWFSIFRLALVQTALGAIVVITTSTINRVIVVELALPAMVPGALVTLHHAMQILRPRWGHGSDIGGRRTPWIVGGMAVLALGGTGAAVATAVMASNLELGLALAVVAFVLVGVGLGATGTNLLALLATRVAPERRAPAATMVWLMMIAGFIVTSIVAGSVLDPFTPTRLVAVTAAISAAAFVLASIAIVGIEGRNGAAGPSSAAEAQNSHHDFKAALRQVWSEPQARRFTIFIFVSMLSYSMQDLILEPYGGLVFGLSPGETTKLSGVQNGGVFLGMLLVAVAANPRFGLGSLRTWAIGGCLGSSAALIAIVLAAQASQVAYLKAAIFALGFANGAFAVAAIGSMMALASTGSSGREGMRMGIWGASQALSFGLGGFLGTVAVDALRSAFASHLQAYACVFSAEALLFLLSAALALRAMEHSRESEDARGLGAVAAS